MHSILPAIACAGLAVLASGCTTAAPPKATMDQLPGSSWQVAGLNAGGVQTRRVTITFEKDGWATGNAGCNDYRAAYEFQDGRLKFARTVALTDGRICDQDTRETQTHFLATLNEVRRAAIAPSGSLVLYTGTIAMRITARPAPTRSTVP